MKSFNRILIILLIFTIIISTCGAYAASDTTIIYDKKISVIRNEETPDNGIVYIDDLRFLKDGMFLARDVIIPKIPPIRMLITLQILKGVKYILFQFSVKTRVNKFIT